MAIFYMKSASGYRYYASLVEDQYALAINIDEVLDAMELQCNESFFLVL